MSATPVRTDIRHEEILVEVLSRIHPLALGVSVGIVAAGGLFLLTAFHILARPELFPLRLLREFFPGYQQTWLGASIGAAWMFGAGFVAGWGSGVVHNFTVRTWLMIVNTRAELTRDRDVLDQLR